MGVIELLISIGVWLVTLVAMFRIITKAGYSRWWVLVPLTPPVLLYATLFAVRTKAAFSTLNAHTLVHTEQELLMASLAAFFVAWVCFLVFAFSDWPALRAKTNGSAQMVAPPVVAPPSTRLLGPRGHVPPPLTVRPLPNVEGKPAGWYPTGVMGSGEQTYWNGEAWTARRQWRNEMWIDLPAPEMEGAARG